MGEIMGCNFVAYPLIFCLSLIIKVIDTINKGSYTYIKIRDLSDILNIMYDNNTKLISVGIK